MAGTYDSHTNICSSGALAAYTQPVPAADLTDATVDEATGIAYTRQPARPGPSITPCRPSPATEHGRPVGLRVGGRIVRGFDTPSRKLEFWSPTLAEWGWPEVAIPTYIKSHVHRDHIDIAAGEFVLIPTFRLPTLIHTRSGNAKWLAEISLRNPLWLHPVDAGRLGVATNDLVRVTTAIGYFVLRAWLTEGIRPGIVACSHHMGRWRLQEHGTARWSSALVDLQRVGDGQWKMTQRQGVTPWASDDPDSSRVWWTDAGVHQNLTFPVHPDPVSGMHCWHQKVTVAQAEPADRYGDIFVDTNRAAEIYREWLAWARPGEQVSPDGTRRPYWLLRPFRPVREAYRPP